MDELEESQVDVLKDVLLQARQDFWEIAYTYKTPEEQLKMAVAAYGRVDEALSKFEKGETHGRR